ncbi:hypothetical protein ATP_00091 [Candidatus Phytoplasma mali]|uniref:Uncharacterized protein n=1 Tax=Phytoplasma mali (strain AT) TaxID=482235 RepID=B3R0B4_PHYMT|nr:hypothetical protein [Candidatus Phytoplasma mali]CAP18278.1 hypothetical protein ATP_00091 [Candidatus Phytoplasma mali]
MLLIQLLYEKKIKKTIIAVDQKNGTTKKHKNKKKSFIKFNFLFVIKPEKNKSQIN